MDKIQKAHYTYRTEHKYDQPDILNVEKTEPGMWKQAVTPCKGEWKERGVNILILSNEESREISIFDRTKK